MKKNEVERPLSGDSFEFNGKKYPIRSETERDEDFHRYSTFIQINGKEFCASPCHLSGSGSQWKNELIDCIKKNL